jgi:hypothetical protein
MVECNTRIQNFEDIRQYVTDILSDIELLRPESSQLKLRLLTRSGQPCGVYFCLHGPRAVRLSAIWETDANTILFYGSRGERVQRTRLLEAPELNVQAFGDEKCAA